MYDPWQQWRVPDPQRPWQPPYRTSTSTTFTYRQTQTFDAWAEAVKFALKLRTTGQCHTKPDVRSRDNQWVVSWVPAFFVSYNAA